MNETIVNIIIKYTDIQGKLTQGEDKWTPLVMEEAWALTGILIMIGFSGKSCASLEDIWSVEGYGIENIQNVMSKNRFRELISNLRFDDKSTRTQRKQKDKFAPIRDLCDEFNKNLRKYFIPGVCFTKAVVSFSRRGDIYEYRVNKSSMGP